MTTTRIRAVLFDLWGTLIYNIPRRTRLNELAEVVGLPAENIWQAWSRYNDACRRGQIKSSEERARKVLEYLGRPHIIFDQAIALMAEFERENRTSNVTFYPGVEEMLETLRLRGYKTGIISNCNYLTPGVVDQIGLREKVDLVILSVEVGLIKPELEIYRLATERLGVKPEECFYVGDGGDNEMHGAKQIGFTTCLVEQERGHAYRNPDKEFDVDHRLPVITAVLDYLEDDY